MTGSRSKIVGIDLGTTYSLVAVLSGDEPVVLPNALGELLTPSAVSIAEDGSILVGAPARARATTHPARTALAFKRDMGTDRTYSLGDRTFTPAELSACVLRALKHDAEVALGHAIEEAVVTVPAYFGDLQRQATRDAGAIAGLSVERIVNEPTAAALAYGLHARTRELKAVVLDLGGGTFDVTVIEIIEGVVEVRASAGDARLGGEDFVDVLAEEVATAIRDRHGEDVHAAPTSWARLRDACELAKKRLSTDPTTRVVLPSLALGTTSHAIEQELTREAAEASWAPLIERMRAPTLRALRDASLRAEDIDEVLLVGGATRMPCVVRLASQIFGRLPLRTLPPDEAVVMGAAVQAALKEGAAAVDDLVVTDVAPFTLGIASASKLGRQVVDGLFAPIIERGTVIPASRVERFVTMEDHQRQIVVRVYQGEHSQCRDNVKLGELVVGGLPASPAGHEAIDVRFTYDLNGILDVDTTVLSTGKTESLVIERSPGRMSKHDVAKAREAMRRLKFHPRDALPNATALARGDALYAELVGADRAALGESLGHMRAALEAQDVLLITECREALVTLTAALRRPQR